jgi:predicted RND superfamily exporter protein
MKTLTRLALERPGATLAACALATLALAAGLPRLETEVGYRAFLGEDHPAVVRFDAFLQRFGGGLPVAVVWSCADPEPKCEDVFDADALAMARAITLALRSSPDVRRAESPATATLLLPARPPLPPRPRHFFESDALAPDRAALARRARSDPLWLGELVSADGRVGALVIELKGSDGETATRVWQSIEAALAPFEAEGWRYRAVGGPVEFVVAGGELERATAQMIPLMVALVGVLLLVLLRAIFPALALLATVGIAVLWAHGFQGWLGWGRNTLTQTLAPLVLVIGVCDGIHLIARWATPEGLAARNREARARELVRAAGEVGAPCVMTTLTTAAGFLSFVSSDLASFAHFGVVAAFGVGAALLLCFTLLPILLLSLPAPGPRSARTAGSSERALAGLNRLTARRAPAILFGAALLAASAAVGIARLRVDASFEDLYGARSRVVQWVHFVGEHLRGPDTLEVEVQLPPGVSAAAPETLARIGAAADRLVAALPEVTLGRSLALVLSWTHRLFAGDDPLREHPGATRSANEVLLEILARDPADPAAPWLDAENGRLRISLASEKPSQARMRELLAETRSILAEELPDDWTFELTGPIALVHEMIDAIRTTQLRSFALAGAVVMLLVALFLRSAGWALVAMLPTALPVWITLGVMGLLRIRLDVGSAMVAAVVLGIAVDDAIHLLARYRRQRAAGEPPADAIEGAVLHTGRALITTSVALAVGFLALGLSPWQSVASFGLLSGAAILAALASVLVVLPALLHFGQRGARKSRLS